MYPAPKQDRLFSTAITSQYGINDKRICDCANSTTFCAEGKGEGKEFRPDPRLLARSSPSIPCYGEIEVTIGNNNNNNNNNEKKRNGGDFPTEG